MLTTIRSIGLRVHSLEIVDKWVVGQLADHEAPTSSPRAPWINTSKSLRKAIKDGTLATAVPPFYLPLASSGGFFRTLEASILEDFLQIHDGQTDEMAAFIRRHGLFAEEDLRLRARAAKEVQTRWKHIKAIGVIPFAIPLHEFWGTRRTIEALSDLMDALQRGEEERMLALSLELGSGFIKGYEDHRISDAYADARFLLAAVTGRWLATARVAPVEEKGKFITSIVTAFSRDAVYAQLMAHITAGNPLRRCKRLKCEVIFVPSRPDKQFCSLKCQNLAKSYRQKGIPNVERASTSLR